MALRSRKRRRRLRRSGQVFILISGLVLLAAWNTGTNLYYLVFGGLASFLVASWLLSSWNLRRLHLRREAPDAVHRGTTFSVRVAIENRRRILPATSVRIESTARPGESAGFAPSIPGGTVAQLAMTESFDKRGVFRLPDLQLVTAFPFGLIECRRRIADDDAEVVVYPRIRAARTALVERTRGSGDVPRVSLGSGDEFFSLREYIPGDDLRHIAWRASAKLGNLMVKELELQSCRSVLFVFDSRFDTQLPDFDERFEDSIELVASLAVTLLARQYSVAVLTATDYLLEDEGKAQVLKVLDMLARLQPAGRDMEDPFCRAAAFEEFGRAIYLYVSPDPARWGAHMAGGARILHPQEVIHA
jgi:uncharacterized protein (DUF58 family)